MTRSEELFPGWAPIWRRVPAIAVKLDHVRELRGCRARGNQYLPNLELDESFRRCLALYPLMRAAEEGRSDLSLQQAYQAHAEVILTFTPVVHRAFWARWLYLERALELASDIGDLLLGALVLRTMDEDVWAVRELQTCENAVSLADGQGATHEDFRRIRAHGDLLWTRFLPPKVDLPTLPGNSAPERFSGHGDGQLRSVFQRLNDYVHPNYGSHLLSLFPERSVAADALLDAFITIYEAFFQVTWVETTVSPPITSLLPIAARSWPEEAGLLKNETLPEIQRHRADRGLAHPFESPAPNVLRWIEHEVENDVFATLPEWFAPIRGLAEVVLGTRPSDPEAIELLRNRPDLGFPPRGVDLIVFAGARELASKLERNFPAGAPSHETSLTDWLRFTESAIALALTTTQHKMNFLRVAMVRQLNGHNPLGSILTMRSLVEHQAVALYLGERLKTGWEDLAKHSSSGALQSESLRRLEHDIARFLAGTKGTAEEQTRWKTQWALAGLDRHLNSRSVENGLKPREVLAYLYDFGSEALHGRRARGIELCPPADTAYARANLSRAALALDDLTGLASELDIIAEAHRVQFAMKALREALERTGADLAHVIKTTFGPKESLKKGNDYIGEGTESSPYIFISGIPYYDAFAKLCSQLGLDTEKRQVQVDADGRMFDVVSGTEREHFFLVPKDQLA